MKCGVVGNTLFTEFHVGEKSEGGLTLEIKLFGVYLFIHLFIPSSVFILSFHVPSAGETKMNKGVGLPS